MIEVSAALRILLGECRPLETVRVDLQAALSHVLAETVVADRDFPPTDRSAMDGFAVRTADLATAGGELSVAGELRAGEAPGSRRLQPGEALRVFTGAVVPPGADSVVMVEDVLEDRVAGTVRIPAAVRPGQHIRFQAADLGRGQLVLERGTPIRAAEIAALASVGCTRPLVHRKPAVSVLATGDEVVEPDVVPLPHQVRNSNAPALLAQLGCLGLSPAYAGIARDDAPTLAAHLAGGLTADVLLVTGGVSVGDYDLVGAALRAAGMRVLFHKVSMKPGKPILVGRAGRCLVFGLPGNPVSAFAGFAIFVAPALRALMGHPRPGPHEIDVVLAAPLKARPGRTTYHLARIETGPAGRAATPIAATGSGDVLALARANGFVITDAASQGAAAGETLKALAWD